MVHMDENRMEAGDSYEVCPRCNANLTLQKGFDSRLPYWLCLGCGEMLINPEVDAEDDIVWRCDRCGAMLNIQPGFRDNDGEWMCTECGFVNTIDASEVYPSEDAFQAAMEDPYRGLSDEAVCSLSFYLEEKRIQNREDILLGRHRETGVRYIKKLLGTYDKSIYQYLMGHPVRHMPKIVALFEGENRLIVIEEYIEGKTLAETLEERLFPETEAIAVAEQLCGILEELHTLPVPIVHRDIKPSNIMISPEGKVVLLDVNVAKWYDPDQSADTRYMGTIEYAAPEQAGFGLKASSAKSDIYAVGILLNVMLTGRYPRDQRAAGPIWEIIEHCIRLAANERYTEKELMQELLRLEEGKQR